MMKHGCWFLLFWVMSIGSLPAQDATATPLFRISVLEDQSGSLNYIQAATSEQFLPAEKTVLSFGLTHSVHWLKVEFDDPRLELDSMYLVIDFPQTGEVQAFEDGSWFYQAGYLLPFSNRPVGSASFAIPFPSSEKTERTVFLRTYSDRTKILPVSLEGRTEFWKNESLNNTVYGIYFGILAGLFLYNLFLFFGLRDRAYLLYVLSIASTFTLVACMSGKMLQFVMPENPHGNRLLLEFASASLSFFIALFTRSFLDIRKFSPWLDKVFIAIASIALCSPLLLLFDPLCIQHLLYNLLSIQVLFTILAGVWAWKKNNPYAGYFIIAWLGYMVGGLLTVARDNGILPFGFLTNHGVEIGSGMEVILISMALGKRYQAFRKEKDEAMARVIQVQKEANETLEAKVQERTRELSEKSQSLQVAYTEIRDSIVYASRIQQALLPEKTLVQKAFPDSFIFFRPKDIVSGDFYWLRNEDDSALLVAADCTGHGVPGALMTVVGSTLLTELSQPVKPDTAALLSSLDIRVREAMKQDTGETNDGMDLAIIHHDRKNNMLRFSGARRPLFHFRNGTLTEYKGSVYPIGSAQYGDQKQFEEHTISVNSGDVIYLFSDGYQDQFGGPNGKKFMLGKLRELLVSIHELPMNEQEGRIASVITEWKGSGEQTDDLLVIGVRF